MISGDRTYYLFSDTAEAATAWVKVLSEVIETGTISALTVPDTSAPHQAQQVWHGALLKIICVCIFRNTFSLSVQHCYKSCINTIGNICKNIITNEALDQHTQ